MQGKLYDLGVGIVDQYGAPGTAASDIAAFGKDFVIGPEPVEGKPPNVTIPGTFPTERFMAEVLAHNGAGNMAALDGIYENGVLAAPPDQDGTDRYSKFHNKIGDYHDRRAGHGQGPHADLLEYLYLFGSRRDLSSMTMRKFLVTVAALALLSGCGPSTPKPGNPAPSTGAGQGQVFRELA